MEKIRIIISVFILITFFSLATILMGCGTIRQQIKYSKQKNTADYKTPSPQIYGATISDIKMMYGGDVGGESAAAVYFLFWPLIIAFCIADLPISITTDTVLLPWGIYSTIQHDKQILCNLNSIWGANPDNIFIAGIDGSIYRYANKKWGKEEIGKKDQFYFVNGNLTGDLIMAGNGFDIYSFSYGKWIKTTSNNVGYGLWSTVFSTKEKQYAIIDHNVLHITDGPKTIDCKIPIEDLGSYEYSTKTIWGTSCDNIFIYFDYYVKIPKKKETNRKSYKEFEHYNKVARFHNGEFSIYDFVDIHVNSFFGFDDKNIYAVCDNGIIGYFDGNDWRQLTVNIEYINQASFKKMWGTSPDSLYVVGELANKSLILHYDGKTWTIVFDKAIHALNSIWGFSNKDIWAVGDMGTFVHYDGKKWNIAPQYLSK